MLVTGFNEPKLYFKTVECDIKMNCANNKVIMFNEPMFSYNVVWYKNGVCQ